MRREIAKADGGGGPFPDEFLKRLRAAAPSAETVRQRQWIYVAYDRLNDAVGPLSKLPADGAGIVLVESREKAMRRPYHKKKLTLLLSNERHFALEQLAAGRSVIYWATRHSIDRGLLDAQRHYGLPELVTAEPAERELRLDLARGVANGLRIRFQPDTAWLSTEEDFRAAYGDGLRAHYLMDTFYRRMRQKTGVLMTGSANAPKPAGGKWSLDEQNRQPFRGQVPVPSRQSFAPDDVTREVMALVEREFPQHFGSTEGFDLPVTRDHADAFWSYCLRHFLPLFGPYEDAMVTREPQMFHTQTSALLNLGRLLPQDLVRDAEAAYQSGAVPLASAEGFIRQLLGWREYMRHVHRVTEGYRKLPEGVPAEKRKKGRAEDAPDAYAGAAPNALGAKRKLPAVYWGNKSGMFCMDTVVADVLREGWSHHITRLMVLSNFATLAGYSPRELTDWFWFAYIDAYDWVVEPNVLGMATYSDGGLTATKPYVSGAAYINRMSDYCSKCRFDPKKALGPDSCPFTALYWTFMADHEQMLSGNMRMKMPYATLARKPQEERDALRARAEEMLVQLDAQTY